MRPWKDRSAPAGGRAADDPVAERIRTLRRARGLTLDGLAAKASEALEAGAPGGALASRSGSVSASYICLIESGRKVPDEAIAVALARSLGDDPRLYRAWVHARKRADLATALAATDTLRRLLAGSRLRAAARGSAGRMAGKPGAATGIGAASARIRVPVVAEGTDPGPGLRPACEVLEWRRLRLGELSSRDRDRLDRPFAYRLSERGVRRVRHLLGPGDHVIVLRRFGTPSLEDVCAVRVGDRAVLSRVMWNGSHLLVRPADGESDFSLLEARDEGELRSLILGLAIPVRFEPVQGPP